MKNFLLFLLFAACSDGFAGAVRAATINSALADLRAVGLEGSGNAKASTSWKDLAAADAKALPKILSAMDGANDLALNWLRSAVDSIAARTLKNGGKLPIAALEKFIHDTKHNPRARRLAYELVTGVNPDAAPKLLSKMLDDPSTELRRDAVQRVMDEAGRLSKAGRNTDATGSYETALRSARDVDQIDGIAKELKALGMPVDLPKVFGWLTQWKVIGPFDSTSGAGFEKVYPPEERIDFKAEFDGKKGMVRWQEVAAKGDYGIVDFNKPCGELKEVAGYASTEVNSDKARPVELRMGCENAWKVWLNGKLIFGHEEYHRMTEIDQYRMPVELKPGSNTILVKVCQNQQVEDWTKAWEFQLRITDALGTPVTFAKH
ncbi:MAG: hypothetical protein EXS31_14520 [Pedosphaera sp.]|nr:hypothetical protein [Pedosphaera sp.]